MKIEAEREELSQKLNFISSKYVCSPSNKYLTKYADGSESSSLCALRKGSLTIEAALIIPFFLTILLAFFSLFLQYSLAADLKVQAAAEAKILGIVAGYWQTEDRGEIIIYKTSKIEQIWTGSYMIDPYVTQKALCRAWVGFTGLESEETYVYITPEGSVYHMFRDCTHLNLSVERVTYKEAISSENEYGEKYRKCRRCEVAFGSVVYITKEGDCYHSERECSGLKRTIRQVPMSEVKDRSGCMRCMSREE